MIFRNFHEQYVEIRDFSGRLSAPFKVPEGHFIEEMLLLSRRSVR